MQVPHVQSPPFIDSSTCFRIVGSVNGFLCFTIHLYHVYHPSILLWNPATREVRQVPPSRTSDYFACNFTGFGFSPIVNDYVIVKNFVKVEYDDVVTRAEVYSLRTGSWKEIECANFVSANSFDCGVAANGAIFWDGIKREKDEFFYHFHNNSNRTP